ATYGIVRPDVSLIYQVTEQWHFNVRLCSPEWLDLRQPAGIRVELAAQPARGCDREAQGQRAAAGRGERDCGAVAQHRCAKAVRHYQATFFGDEKNRELVRNS